MKLTIEFSGGLELLFDRVKKHNIEIDEKAYSSPITMKEVIHFIRDNLLRERVELFMQDDTVRPGILVLINDADWELEDGLKYRPKENDTIVFISTLHGG